MATSYYDYFIKKLQEIFMMDHAELDFGIYRIMNQKRSEIEYFLKNELLPQVNKALSAAHDTAAIQTRMKEMETQEASFGVSAEANPEYQRLKQQLQQSADTDSLQNEVFSHLVTFFSRYYDNGDFLSKRRYKDNTYAIPYNGEEVKLHWANADQYYIKSSEYFRDYSFVLPNSRRKVHFVLKDASTEQNNNKSANNMERRFALYKPEAEGELFYEVNGEELNIFFTYELMPKATKQTELMAEALTAIQNVVPEAFSELLTERASTDKNSNRTLIEKHLTDYTAKNSFDYFIHKDLGGFLRRELDFYIKNEVMLLDDLDAKHIANQLNVIKAIKTVGEKIIHMLAQLEDFQKKLWLKKKFVVQCDYCITLDRVPRDLYPEILANDRQREEWVRLFAIDEIKGDVLHEGYSEPLTMNFLEQNQFLVLDTAFFPVAFKHKLISSMENIDRDCNGLLINSENFQALELLQEKYRNSIKCTYIDPPYNAKSSEILYKNTFKHSSWISLMYDRLCLGKNLNANDFVYTIAIDEVEQENLGYVLNSIYPDNKKVCLSVVHNPRGQQGKNVSYIHEFAFIVYPDDKKKYLSDVKRDDIDSRNLRDSGTESNRTDAATCFYPILVKNNKIVGFGDVPPENYHPVSPNIALPDGIIEVWPIDPNGNEKKWRYGRETVPSIQSKLEPKTTSSIQIIFNQDLGVMKSLWRGSRYDASEYGTKVLQDILTVDGAKCFSYPKSINTVFDCTNIAFNSQDGICLDYFAGSGTTAHAVIKQNRTLNTHRYYILCEMGIYFDVVTRTRVQKTIYSDNWTDGKPVSRDGISQCFKYMRLEQYEDTLNNLELKQDVGTMQFEDKSQFKESYMLGYMLDVETRDSLLNLKMFENPFAMTLKTTKDNELVDTPVDMVETFNYLIGLNVETTDWYKDDNICVVQGYTHRDNLHTLIIWRNCNEIDNDKLNIFFERMDFRTRDSEFDVIYVNGDNTLPNLRRDEDCWKVVLIEEEFGKRMFEEE